MTSACRDCREGFEHCHGTVIHHVLLRAECTEEDCVTPEAAHEFSVDCDAIGCTCSVSVALALRSS